VFHLYSRTQIRQRTLHRCRRRRRRRQCGGTHLHLHPARVLMYHVDITPCVIHEYVFAESWLTHGMLVNSLVMDYGWTLEPLHSSNHFTCWLCHTSQFRASDISLMVTISYFLYVYFPILSAYRSKYESHIHSTAQLRPQASTRKPGSQESRVGAVVAHLNPIFITLWHFNIEKVTRSIRVRGIRFVQWGFLHFLHKCHHDSVST